MKSITSQSHLHFIAFMIMLSTFLPLVFENLPPFIRSHHIWTALWLFSIIFLKFKIFVSNLMGTVIIYSTLMILLLFNILWVEVDEWNKNHIIKEIYEISVAVSVLTYFRMEKDYFGFAKIIKWTMIFIFITAVMSIVTAIINPMYARNIISVSKAVSESERLMIMSYQKYGGGGYSFASALICLFPILMYYLKNSQESYFGKKIILLMIIVNFLALIAVQISANIIISALIILFSWFGSKNAKSGFVIVGILSLIIIILPVSLYIDLLQNIATLFNPSSDINFKLNDMSLFLATGGNFEDSSMGYRAERYPLLFESFLANPFFGHFLSDISYKDISEGGHLFLMNKLAVFGLFGTLPFIYIIYKYVKINLRYFNKEYSFYFLLSILSVVILSLMKAVVGREFWYTFFIILPGLYYLPLLKKNYHGQ